MNTDGDEMSVKRTVQDIAFRVQNVIYEAPRVRVVASLTGVVVWEAVIGTTESLGLNDLLDIIERAWRDYELMAAGIHLERDPRNGVMLGGEE